MCCHVACWMHFFYLLMRVFEPESGAGLGAVLVSERGTVMAWFGLKVNVDQLSTLMEGGKKQ